MTHNNKILSKQTLDEATSTGARQLTDAEYAELQLKAQILDLGADSIIVADGNGAIVYTNETACKSHGYTREEFHTMNMRQLISGVSAELVEEFEKKIDEHQHEGAVIVESVDICKDGSYLPVESHTRVIEHNGNKYYLNIARDITERKKMLQELEESEKNFRMLAENAKDMIIHLQLSPSFKLEYISPSAVKITGYTPEELYADPGLAWKCIYPEDMELFRKYYELKHFDDKPVILRWICKDGSIKWGEHLNSAIHDSHGDITGVQVMVRDITEQQEMLKALEESEKNFRMLAENAKDMIMRIQLLPTMEFTYVSPSCVAMTGYTPEEFYADPELARKSVHPDDRIAFENIEQHLDKPITLRFAHKDGRIIWTEQLISTIQDEKGNITGSQVICRDVTERKQIEKTLADEATRRHILFEKSNDGIVILDNNGKILETNQRFADMLGYSREELKQLHVWDWDTALSKEQHIKLLRHENFTEKYIETIQRRKDGSLFYTEINSNKAEVAGQWLIFSMCRDITERKQAEQALADEATRRRILVDQSRDGIVVLDRNGKVFEANRRFAEMLGYSPEEVRQLHVWDWDAVFSKAQLDELLNRDEIADDHFETRQRRKDGTLFDVEMSGASATIAERSLIFCVCRDITERKQAEAEQKTLLEKLQDVNIRLEQSNQALQDFAYIASHDLREPLRKISAFGSLLEESLPEKMNDDEKENLEFMIDGAQRMQEMIDDLLTYSRLTTMAKAPKSVDLNTVVRDLEKIELAAKLDETGGVIAIPHKLPTVLAEESQMRQLFQNLIGNGLKYHKPDIPPSITISSEEVNKHMVRIDIQDNGIGISEEYHEKVFIMFKRLHSRSSFEGNGIGLAVCKKIVNRHGGDIGVKSKADEGSTFWFTLPLP